MKPNKPGEDADYDVGYGKPPEHTRFQKGQSGNPKGRPKGSVNLITVVNKALQEKVSVTENGRRKTITKLEAAVKQAINKAAGGDHKSVQLVISLANMVEGEADKASQQTFNSEADRQVMASLAKRLSAAKKEEGTE